MKPTLWENLKGETWHFYQSSKGLNLEVPVKTTNLAPLQQTHVQSFEISHGLFNLFPSFQHLTFANAGNKSSHPRDYPRQCRRMPHAEGNFAVAKSTICVRCLRHKFLLAHHRNSKRVPGTKHAESESPQLWPLRLRSPEPCDRNVPHMQQSTGIHSKIPQMQQITAARSPQ